MANKLPVLNEAEQGLGIVQKRLIELNAEVKILEGNLVKISQKVREIPKYKFDAKTPREANIPIAERSKLLKELMENQKRLEETNKKLAASNERLKNAKRQLNIKTSEEIVNNRILSRNAKEQAVLTSKLTSEYQKLVTRMNIVGRTVQNLNAKKEQGIVLSKKEQDQLRKSQAQFSRYNKAVIAADASINRFQRNVGNYGLALKGLAGTFRSLVGALGVTSGFYLFVGILRSGLQTLRDFGASMANLAGIFRVTREDLAPLEADIIAVAGASVKTATEVAKLAEALATLGKSKEEISDLLEPVNNLSIGLGASSEETAEFLVQTINAFGGSTKEALKYADTIATIRTSTSLNFQRMRDSFQYLTPISQILNKDLAYTGALIGIVADSGIKAERAGRLLGTAQQKLAKEGSTLAQALEEVNEASARGIKEEKLLAIASNLFGKQAASLGIILAQNSDIIETNAQAIRDNGGALDDLVNEQLKSLDSSLLILKSRWEQYILNTDDATGSSGKLIKTINFLGDNLGVIINTIITVVKWFSIYKGLVFLAGVQTAFMSKRLALLDKAALSSAKGISRASLAFARFNKILRANILGITVLAIGGLIWAYNRLNKSIVDTAKELNESSKEFTTQHKETQKVNDELNTMVSRYDELKGKTNLNAKEQKELNTIIETIGKTVPGAVTEIDKYGKALEINTGKVKEFNELNGRIATLEAGIKIKGLNKTLEKLKTSQAAFNKVAEQGNATTIKGFGLIRQQGTELYKLEALISKGGRARIIETKLTDEQETSYRKAQKAIEDSIITAKNSIKANQEVIKSVAGVTEAQKEQNRVDNLNKEGYKNTARQREEIELLIKTVKDENLTKDQKLQAIKRLNEISPDYLGSITLENININKGVTSIDNYIKALDRKGFAQALANKKAKLQKDIIDAENSSLEDNILFSEKLENSLISSINVTNSIEENEKTSIKNRNEKIKGIKAEIAALDDLMNTIGVDTEPDPTPDSSVSSRGAAYNTKLKEFEAIKLFNQQILNNEKSTGAERLIASNSFYKAEKDLLDLNKNLAIRQAKGNADKLVDIGLKYDRDILNNEQKREDAAFKILEDSFKEKLTLIKDAQDAVKIEMQAAIDEQNKLLGKSGNTPKDVERIEKKILKIKKNYAIKGLETARAATIALAALEGTSENQRTQLLRDAAALQSSILQLKAEEAIGISKDKAKKDEEILKAETLALENIEQLKEKIFRDRAKNIADAFGLSADKINRAIDSFSENADTNGDKVIDKFEKIIQVAEKIGAVVSVFGDITNTVFDNNIAKYDEDIEANNEYYTQKLDNEKLSDEQRSALEAERDRKNAEIEKKKQALEVKQAKARKAFQAFEIAIDTIKKVVAIKTQVAVLSANPLTLPFAAIAASLIPVTIAAGAVAAGAVLAQPIPKYKHGRTGGDAEFAYVGDGGVSEIIARAGGGYEITPNRETLTYLNKGDSVLPDASKFLHEQAYNMSLSSIGDRIGVTAPKIDIDTLNKTIERQTQALTKAMGKNKTSVRVHNNNSIGADLKFLNRLNDTL